MKTSLPIARIVRLTAKAVRLSRGGLTPEEARELAADLLHLGADILEKLEAERG